jgi:hypothetical protein
MGEKEQRRVMERQQRRHTYVRAPPLLFAMDPERIGRDRTPRALSDQLLLEESRAHPDKVLDLVAAARVLRSGEG